MVGNAELLRELSIDRLDDVPLCACGYYAASAWQNYGIFALGPLGVDLLETLAGLWFDGRQQDPGTELFIGVMLFADLAGLPRYRGQRVTDQETGPLIKTDDRIAQGIGQGIERQNALQVCQKGGIQVPEAPGLGQMRLEGVFLSTLPTMVCQMVSQKPNSTAFSARRRRDQRA